YSITLEVTDASGNTADCTFDLNVNDTELPTIACPSTQTRLVNGSCNYILEDFASAASVNDNCSVQSVTQSIPAGTNLSTGTYAITLEVTDASGNTADCTFELNVNDTELPTIACPSTQTRLVNGRYRNRIHYSKRCRTALPNA
ncbi:MAG: HYR domain-containing protein, partial [Flavobacteriales bacterium]|nr:HYR domain-containing protein [Flavobacteriales bacterium]